MIEARTLPAAYAAPGLSMRDDAAVLADVMMDPVQVAVWDRRSPIDPQRVTLACSRKMAIKIWLDASDLTGSIARSLPGDDFAPLREDLALLAEMMACLFGTTGVGLRVTALEKPMCPRFHVDRIPVRMLCTYGGPGSQWLPAPSVPAGLLVPGVDQEGRYAADSVQQLQAGQVALFKGDTWRDNPGSGVVHRSPPVSPGQQRLLVTLDI